MENMNFNEFKQYTIDNIKDFMSEKFADAEVSVREVMKNNDTKLSGLTITIPGDTIAPTVYLEDFYRRYSEEGISIDEILDGIAYMYINAYEESSKWDSNKLFDKILDYESVKDRIFPRLVNREFNKERLPKIPHIDYDGDLAVTYHVELDEEYDPDEGRKSILVTKEMLEKYGVSVEELHEKACENMKKNTPSEIESMAETLAKLMIPHYELMTAEEKEEAKEECGLNEGPGLLYVLSNKTKVFGAAAVLDTEIMDKFFKEHGSFYLLPSSVHEAILVPKNAQPDMDVETLENMVCDVNATQVAPNEILSNKVYEYSSDDKMIHQAMKMAA